MNQRVRQKGNQMATQESGQRTDFPDAALATGDLPTGDLPEVLDGFDLTDLDRFSAGFPHEVFSRLRSQAPIFYHPAGHSRDGEGFWVLSRYADMVTAGSDIA